uniref:uncharacterized protein LOC122603517 n=1 Tax=Erigeron canadensis TaxID=72917 RepID=UPI001CB9C4CF|nr:uncharacterized protein LOC122603517 [Erigeron canadensis]
MNSSLNSLHHYPPINHHYPPLPKPNLHRSTPTCSLRRRRHFRRRRNTIDFTTTTTDATTYPPDPDSKLHMVIRLDNPPVSIHNLLNSFNFDLNEFIESGNDAVLDLQTLITVDSDKRVVVSCRKSTVYFMGKLVVLSLVSFVIFKVLNILRLGFGSLLRKRGGVGGEVVTRRDRSLGGREVVVSATKKDFRNEGSVNVNPLSSVEELRDSVATNWERSNKRLPDWWPDTHAAPLEGVLDMEESQRKANSLIRAILDYRTSGEDLQEDDIISLRQICRMSGVKVFIENNNSRDSIFRTSVDFILNTCARVASHSTFVQIDGEDAREFIAGLADNIGLESFRAARIVTAAVAARTRSWLLQAWALEMQGKPIEAVNELSKLCLVHRIFPPIENSPEMEMVANGLEKHLKPEQREYLMKMLIGISSEENRRSLVEALGLEMSAGSVSDQEENVIKNQEL